MLRFLLFRQDFQDVLLRAGLQRKEQILLENLHDILQVGEAIQKKLDVLPVILSGERIDVHGKPILEKLVLFRGQKDIVPVHDLLCHFICMDKIQHGDLPRKPFHENRTQKDGHADFHGRDHHYFCVLALLLQFQQASVKMSSHQGHFILMDLSLANVFLAQ